MRCAIELFQNLTKHASEVDLKVGYDVDGQCHLRSENDVAPVQWDGLQHALAPVVELDMVSLKATGWRNWSMALGRTQVGQAWA